jgi:SpoIID/LytB domain protein
MRRRAFLSICVTILAASWAAGPVLAAGPGTGSGADLLQGPRASATATSGSITVYGSGDGHGIGMSQWGAYGLAQQGWTYQQILTHFYSNTQVVKASSPVTSVRIELTYDRTVIHLKALLAPVKLWAGSRGGTPVGQIPPGITWTVTAGTHGYAVRDAHGGLVGGRTWGGPGTNLYATYADHGAHVFVPEADAIWHQGFTYALGSFEFNEYGCPSACRERLIMPIGFEQYLLGIGEMPSSWPQAALRTQAVAARTYATYAVKHYGLRRSCNCDLTDGANDQTYVGYGKVSGLDGARWAGAVTATAGQVVAYKGSVIQSFFAASDGGHSESIQDAWFGGNPLDAVPYLKGVCDPGEYTSANPWTNWKYSYTKASLTSRLAPYTRGIGAVTGFPAVAHAEGGQILRATVKGTSGRATVTGLELRAALGLPEDRAWIGSNKNILGAVRAKYDGLMCAPGLPLTPDSALPGGSRQVFVSGGIYRNNRADVTVWMTGPTDKEYLSVGGAGGVLGLPTSTVGGFALPGGSRAACTCSRITFVGGRIYYKSGVGAHALWGPVLGAYLDHGGALGTLGFPTARIGHNGAGAPFATFEHGTITCPSGGSCSIT